MQDFDEVDDDGYERRVLSSSKPAVDYSHSVLVSVTFEPLSTIYPLSPWLQ